MRRHLTYANVVATLALLFAMSGGAIAAQHYLVKSTKQLSPAVLSSLEAKDRAVYRKLAKTVVVAKATSAATATSAVTAGSATSATHAGEATSATSATTAANALALGGIPASGFTHSDCISQTGQIKGFAVIPENIPEQFTKLAVAYNCSGEAVEAKQTVTIQAVFRFTVRFPGGPGSFATATPTYEKLEDGVPPTAAVRQISPAEWEVLVRPGDEADAPSGVEVVLG